MDLVRMWAVGVTTKVVHDTDTYGSRCTSFTARYRKRETNIGIDGVTRGVEAHSPHRIPRDSVSVRSVMREPRSRDYQPPREPLVNDICPYTHERDLRSEQSAGCAEQEHPVRSLPWPQGNGRLEHPHPGDDNDIVAADPEGRM